MSADKGWNQALLLGGIVAAGGILYYLYSSSSAPRQYDESDDDVLHGDEQIEKDEQNEKDEPPRQKNDDSTASKPLRNPLPPLPERPTAGKRRTASSKPSAAVSKDDSNDTKTSSQAQASKAADGRKTDREPEASSNGADASNHDSEADEDNVLDWSETAEEVIILLAVPASAQKHEVDYKLKPTHLTVSVQGVRLIQATLQHPVQPEDSIWQFDFYQGSRVIMITLQKATNGSGPADWDKLFLT